MKSYFFVGTFASRARVNFGNALADFLWKKWTIVKNGLPLVSAITSFPGRAVLRLINSEKRQDDSSEIPGAPCCTVTGVGSGLGAGSSGSGGGVVPCRPARPLARRVYQLAGLGVMCLCSRCSRPGSCQPSDVSGDQAAVAARLPGFQMV